MTDVAATGPQGGKLTVKIDTNQDTTNILWPQKCTPRRFTADALKELVEWFGRLDKDLPNAWMAGVDSRGGGFWAQIENGILYAEESPHRGASCTWADLRKALVATGKKPERE